MYLTVWLGFLTIQKDFNDPQSGVGYPGPPHGVICLTRRRICDTSLTCFRTANYKGAIDLDYDWEKINSGPQIMIKLFALCVRLVPNMMLVSNR